MDGPEESDEPEEGPVPDPAEIARAYQRLFQSADWLKVQQNVQRSLAVMQSADVQRGIQRTFAAYQAADILKNAQRSLAVFQGADWQRITQNVQQSIARLQVAPAQFHEAYLAAQKILAEASPDDDLDAAFASWLGEEKKDESAWLGWLARLPPHQRIRLAGIVMTVLVGTEKFIGPLTAQQQNLVDYLFVLLGALVGGNEWLRDVRNKHRVSE